MKVLYSSSALGVLMLFFCPVLKVCGQTSDIFKDFNAYTPSAYSFAKVSNTKLNMSTGQITPKIPLFQKKLSVLSLDVTLDFEGGGGILVDDPGSGFGEGWQLNCGGMIVRTLRGMPDDFKSTVIPAGYTSPLTMYNGVLFNGGVAQKPDGQSQLPTNDVTMNYDNGWADGQHDIFDFTLPGGRSGRFYIGEDQTILVTDGSKLLITPQYTSTYVGGEISGFTIVDENGIKYVFNQAEVSVNSHVGSLAPYTEASFYGWPYASGWYLSEIDAPSGEESIKYTYAAGFWSSSFLFDYYSWTRRTHSADPYGQYSSALNGQESDVRSSPLTVSSIGFSDGSTIKFSYSSAANPNFMLQKATLTNGQGQRVKSYAFNYLYYEWAAVTGVFGAMHLNFDDSITNASISVLPQTNAVHLESIDMRDSLNHLLPYYGFTYYLDVNVNEMNLYGKNSEDIWGYYNGMDNTGNLLTVSPNTTLKPANRQTNLTYAELGALKSITYPTGGTETFQYELNDYWNSATGSSTMAGGIRLFASTLSDRTGVGHDLIRTYHYTNAAGQSTGFLGRTLQFNYLLPTYAAGWPNTVVVNFADTISVSTPVNPLSSIEGSPVAYSRVTETTINGNTTSGQTVYTFTDLSYAPLWSFPTTYPYSPVEQPTWAVGLPLTTSHFDAAGHLLDETVNTYNITQSYYTGENYRSLYCALSGYPSSFNNNQLAFIYTYKNLYPLVGRADLASTYTYTYASGGASTPVVTNMVTKQYDPTYHFVRQTTRNDSKGDVLTTIYHYPPDYSLGAGAFPTTMTQENIFDKAISTETWKNNQYLLDCQVTEYVDCGGGLMRPGMSYHSGNVVPLQLAQTFSPTTLLNSNYSMEQNISYVQYDSIGRLLSQADKGSTISSVVLDKSGEIVARADNASNAQVAFTDFEANELPNWNFDPSALTTADRKTGMWSYKGVLTRGNLPSGSYRVGLWAKGSGNVTVNGISTGVTGNWAFYMWNVNGVTAVTINSNGNYIDDVSLYPATGTIKTYTYTTDIGMTSASNANGKIQLFSYDLYTRLKSIADQEGNIVKLYDYNTPVYYNAAASGSYKNYNCGGDSIPGAPATYTVPANQYVSNVSQAAADAMAQQNIYEYGEAAIWYNHPPCVMIWYNVEEFQTFYKQCSAGYYGQYLTYTVSANKYSSLISQDDANNQALAEIAANGQNLANSTLQCEPYVTITGFNENGVPGYWVLFTNQADQSTYEWPISTDGVGTLGQLPQGTYTVQFINTGGNTTPYSLIVGCASSTVGTSATLTNVVINSGCGSVTIE
jgi:hypothetical protein